MFTIKEVETTKGISNKKNVRGESVLFMHGLEFVWSWQLCSGNLLADKRKVACYWVLQKFFLLPYNSAELLQLSMFNREQRRVGMGEKSQWRTSAIQLLWARQQVPLSSSINTILLPNLNDILKFLYIGRQIAMVSSLSTNQFNIGSSRRFGAAGCLVVKATKIL